MPDVAGVILAGGEARRMGGGDKCLKELNGRTLLNHIFERIKPQVSEVLINANGDPARFASFDAPVSADSITGGQGPLAGILTGMEWIADHHPGMEWIATFPGDAPFVPATFVQDCFAVAESEGAEIVCARSNGRTHPVCALWKVSLAYDLRRAMTKEEVRKIDLWTPRHRLSHCDFATDPIDPFFNINTPEDLAEAEAHLTALKVT